MSSYIRNFIQEVHNLVLCMVYLKSKWHWLTKLCSILSAINTATYSWAEFFVSLLKCFTMNEFTLKDSFEFAKDIINQNWNCFMAWLDVDSLFTNVPLDDTIRICIDQLFKSEMTVSGLKGNVWNALINFKRIYHFVW